MPPRRPASFVDVTDSPLDDALAFFLEIDRLKGVERRNFLADGSRRENTAEHSWHLGMAVMIFAQFADEPVDLATAIGMALVHDIVEIDAGDTFAYDQGADAASKEAREQAAADRLFGMLPSTIGQRFHELWVRYELGECAESRLVMAVDRMAPMFLNMAEGGTTWREFGIGRERVIDRNGKYIQAALPDVWTRALDRLDNAVEQGHISH